MYVRHSVVYIKKTNLELILFTRLHNKMFVLGILKKIEEPNEIKV